MVLYLRSHMNLYSFNYNTIRDEVVKATIPASQGKKTYLDVEGSTLNLRSALLDYKGDTIWTVFCCLGKINTKQL